MLFDERVGGPQLRVLQVATRLRERGIETHVVIPKGEPQFAAMLSNSGVPCHELELVRLRQTFRPAPHLRFAAHFWPNVWALRRLIRREKISIVHTNGILGLQAAIAARLERVALVWHLNDVLTPKLARNVLVPLVRAWSNQVAVAAQAVGDYYFPAPHSTNGRLKVLYAPVDTARFNRYCDGSKIRVEFGVVPDQPLIGTVGNFDPVKGHRCMIEAAVKIKEQFPRAKFLLVGQRLENQKDYWQSLVRRSKELGLNEDIIFAGRRADMPEVYRAMDIYVHPSKSEACPMAVLEASASGVPVVATDVGGVRELVVHGETGLIVNARKPSEIVDAVAHLLVQPDLAREMGTSASRRMEQMFSLEVCVNQHLKVYKAALQ